MNSGGKALSFPRHSGEGWNPDFYEAKTMRRSWVPAFAGMTMWLWAVLATIVLASAAHAAPTFPPLTGRVTDAAKMLPADVNAALTAKLEALETATGRQLVVATVPSLEDYPIEDYANGLFRAWKLGEAKTNNGVLLLVAPTEHKVRIEVGYGLEDRLTDALSSMIVRDQIVPSFKAGDMPGGIVAGTDALIAQLQLPADQARANVAAAAAEPRARRHSGGPGFGGLVWLGIIGLWLFFSMFRGSRGRSSGIGNAILWGVASGMFNNSGRGGGGWGGGDGGGWGGGGGGGGFSGGGGSSGGGGASGGW